MLALTTRGVYVFLFAGRGRRPGRPSDATATWSHSSLRYPMAQSAPPTVEPSRIACHSTVVQVPRRNIELKAADPDPSASLEVCRMLGAEDRGTIAQHDTYFEIARGGSSYSVSTARSDEGSALGSQPFVWLRGVQMRDRHRVRAPREHSVTL
jgi:hypothetical protein